MQGPIPEEKPQFIGMADNPMLAKVWRLAEPLCRSEAIELVHVEDLNEGGGRILRIFIDKPGGVTLDDCANISRQLGDLLDVGLETRTSYRLEISSPGMPRPLGKLDDFERFKGSGIKIRTTRSLNGRKNFTGILNDVSGLTVHITVDNQPVNIAFADIKKAYLTNINGENACS